MIQVEIACVCPKVCSKVPFLAKDVGLKALSHHFQECAAVGRPDEVGHFAAIAAILVPD